uniref:Uncharacterized protein n=1 Tax=Romanomermis culicivorax TaxID=13658 RepID=A0A915JUS1_ROMCU
MDEDKENRLEFSQDEWTTTNILVNSMFSDEAHLHLDGGVNRRPEPFPKPVFRARISLGAGLLGLNSGPNA